MCVSADETWRVGKYRTIEEGVTVSLCLREKKLNYQYMALPMRVSGKRWSGEQLIVSLHELVNPFHI